MKRFFARGCVDLCAVFRGRVVLRDCARLPGCVLILFLLFAQALPAEERKAAAEVFFRCVLRDLPLTEGKLPLNDKIADTSWNGFPVWSGNSWNGCRVVLEGPGDAYVDLDSTIRQSILYARTKPGQALKGRIICIPYNYNSPASIVSFELPEERADAKNQQGYFRAKEAYFTNLWRHEVAGSAWFRHQRDVARSESVPAGRSPPPLQENLRRGEFRNESDQMFDLLSGGRAISENLQLRRAIFTSASVDNHPVALDTVNGITTKAVDWSKLIKGLDPKIDPLAALIPADQHAVFIPSFTELLRIADEAEAGATPILHALEPRAEDAGTIDRYQTQLCLSRSGLSRVLGPKYIRSVAITGSDLNYRTGTDVAILFEAVDASDLQKLLETKIKLGLFGRKDVEAVQGEHRSVAYQGYRTADRTISTYLAIVGKAVVVTNSLPQLKRLIETKQDISESLAALPEMKYFRDRYKHGDAEEHALVVLSDATIRRWCGPKWRIGSARQVRELATMMELTSQRLDELVQRKLLDKPLDPEVFQTKVDDYRLLPNGIESPSIGSLRFLTPIAELPLATASRREVTDYMAWRDGYQQNWTRGFDPIAIRLTLLPERIATDITVLPLIDNTMYRPMIDLSSGSNLALGAGDPHASALLHYVFGVGQNSQRNSRFDLWQYLIEEENLGESISIYVDEDPLWQELAKLTPEELRERIEKNCPNLPVALRIGIKDSDKAIKNNIDEPGRFEQLAKGFLGFNTRRTNLTHRGVRYASVSTDREQNFIQFPPSFYITVCGHAVTIAFKEETIKKAIDRCLDPPDDSLIRQKELTAKLGQHARLHLDPRALVILDNISRSPREREVQNLAWSNIPILNEWRRLYPDKDPVELHARLWKTRLVCPGGGKYVWNDEWQTMESTLYGHPAQPKTGPLPSLESFGIRAADFGLTFVDGGLRARAEITRKAPK